MRSRENSLSNKGRFSWGFLLKKGFWFILNYQKCIGYCVLCHQSRSCSVLAEKSNRYRRQRHVCYSGLNTESHPFTSLLGLEMKVHTDFEMKRFLLRLWSVLNFHSVGFLSLSKSFLRQILVDRKIPVVFKLI